MTDRATFPWLVRADAADRWSTDADDVCMNAHGVLHELVEWSLPVLPDLRMGLLGVPIERRHHTRWFRDELAEYLSIAATRSEPPQIQEAERAACSDRRQGRRPLDDLARIRSSLFEWDQFDPHEIRYYDAAFGLFLLLEERFGEEALKRAVRSVIERGSADGEAILETFAETFGERAENVVADFALADWDLEASWECTGGGVAIDDVA